MLKKMEEERGIDMLGQFSGSASKFSGSGSDCLKFSPEKQKSWHLGVFITSSAASVACILAIISILAFKGHKRFVHRLTLYLVAAALLEAVVTILNVIPVYHNGTVVAVGEGFEDFCAAIGFFLEVTVWIPRLFICWIVLYLLMVLVFKHSANAIKWKHEACGLAVVLILPPLTSWVPFVENMYGLSQGGCWIKTSESDCFVGLIWMFVLDYGPQLLVCLVTLYVSRTL